jgi:hypothetical protein
MGRTPKSHWSILIGAALLLGCGSGAPPTTPLDTEIMGDATEPDATTEPEVIAPPDITTEPDISTEPDTTVEPDAGGEPTMPAGGPSPFQATGFGGTSQAAGLTLRPLSMTTTGSSSTPDGALTLEALP